MNGFGERLIKARELKGYNQKQFAEALGITPTRLNYWEKDKREPDFFMLTKIIDLLDTDADSLIGITSKFVVTNKEKNIILTYRALNEDGKKMADTYVNDLAENPKYTNDKSTVNPENLTTADIVQMFRDAAKNTAQVAAFGGQGVTTVKQDLSDDEIRALIDKLKDK